MVVTGGSRVHGLHASNHGSVGSGGVGTQAWEHSLQAGFNAITALVFNGTAVFVNASGALAVLALPPSAGAGAPTRAATAGCPGCTCGDTFSQPPTQLPPGSPQGASFLLLSDGGCATAYSSQGDLLWGPTPPPSLGSSGATATGPAAVFPAPLQLALFALSSGAVCCLDLNSTSSSAANACASWPTACVALDDSLGAYSYSGLAASPASLDYHGGQGYIFSSSGALFVVSAVRGAVASSLNASVPWKAPCGAEGCQPLPPRTPVLVTSVGAQRHKNALVLAVEGLAEGACSTATLGLPQWAPAQAPAAAAAKPQACVFALQVGDGGDAARDDDDTLVPDVDDDGGAQAGVLWAVGLPAGLESLPPTGALAVTLEGTLLVPSSGGFFGLKSPTAAPSPGHNYNLLNGIVLGAVGLGVAGLFSVMLCVAHRRRQRALQAASESMSAGEEGEDNEEEGRYGELPSRDWGAPGGAAATAASSSSRASFVEDIIIAGEGGALAAPVGSLQAPPTAKGRVFKVKALSGGF